MIRRNLLFLLRLTTSGTAKNTYALTFGNGAYALLTFLYTVVLVRFLSLSEFGYFSTIVSFILIVSDIVDFGIGTSLARFVPGFASQKERSLQFLTNAFLLQFVYLIIAIGILSVLSGQIALLIYHSTTYEFFVYYASLGIVGSVITNFCYYALSSRQAFLKAAVLPVTIAVLRLLLLGSVFFTGTLNLSSVVLIHAMSYILSAVIGVVLYGITNIRFRFSFRYIKDLLRFSPYLGIARSITSISGKLDVLMLMAFTNPIETGIYAAASRFIALYPMISGSFSLVLAPRIARYTSFQTLKPFLWKVILATLGLVASLFILFVFAQPLMVLIFTEKIIPSVPVLRVLLFAMVWFVLSIPAVGVAVYFLKKPSILTINSIVQLFIIITINLIGIPIVGKFAPAYALLVAYATSGILTTAMVYYYLRKKL